MGLSRLRAIVSIPDPPQHPHWCDHRFCTAISLELSEAVPVRIGYHRSRPHFLDIPGYEAEIGRRESVVSGSDTEVWVRLSSTGLMQDRLDIDLTAAGAAKLGELLQLTAAECGAGRSSTAPGTVYAAG